MSLSLFKAQAWSEGFKKECLKTLVRLKHGQMVLRKNVLNKTWADKFKE
jgi:hypothetical protein